MIEKFFELTGIRIFIYQNSSYRYRITMTEVNFTIFIEKDEDEGYVARCLELKGVYGQGETEEEALSDIQQSLDIALSYYQEKNLDIPFRRFVQVRKDVTSATTSS